METLLLRKLILRQKWYSNIFVNVLGTDRQISTDNKEYIENFLGNEWLTMYLIEDIEVKEEYNETHNIHHLKSISNDNRMYVTVTFRK